MTTRESGKARSRGVSVSVGVLLIILAVAAVIIGRGGLSQIPGFGGGDGEGDRFGAGNGSKHLTGVIGSEKREFFEDKLVQDRLDTEGFSVEFTTAGSRRIANEMDLSQYDFVFPSSAPAAQKIIAEHPDYTVEYPFFSPMAVATFKPIVEILKREGVVTERDGAPVLEMDRYIDLAQSGKRWRDLSDEFPSPRAVQISTTDIRTSNSAAMFLSILAWQFAEREPDKADDVQWLTEQIAPFFTGQGFAETTSAGPFSDYLSQGMGAVPMVLVYEAQYFGEMMKSNSRIDDDMVLLQLEPTVLAKHGIIGITPEGKEMAKFLANDVSMQMNAANFGFRPAGGDYLAKTLDTRGFPPPPDYVSSVDPPNYDRLEKLIDGVGLKYGSVPPRRGEDHEK